MPYGENLCLNICVPNETCFACLNSCFARPGHLVLCLSPPFFLFWREEEKCMCQGFGRSFKSKGERKKQWEQEWPPARHKVFAGRIGIICFMGSL